MKIFITYNNETLVNLTNVTYIEKKDYYNPTFHIIDINFTNNIEYRLSFPTKKERDQYFDNLKKTLTINH